jgi:putative transposase
MPRRKEPRIPDAVLNQLLAGADAKTAFDPNGLIDDLKKALAERDRAPWLPHAAQFRQKQLQTAVAA